MFAIILHFFLLYFYCFFPADNLEMEQETMDVVDFSNKQMSYKIKSLQQIYGFDFLNFKKNVIGVFGFWKPALI